MPVLYSQTKMVSATPTMKTRYITNPRLTSGKPTLLPLSTHSENDTSNETYRHLQARILLAKPTQGCPHLQSGQ